MKKKADAASILVRACSSFRGKDEAAARREYFLERKFFRDQEKQPRNRQRLFRDIRIQVYDSVRLLSELRGNRVQGGTQYVQTVLRLVTNIKEKVNKLIDDHNKKYEPPITVEDVKNRSSVIWATEKSFDVELIDSWCEMVRATEEQQMVERELVHLVSNTGRVFKYLLEYETEFVYVKCLLVRTAKSFLVNLGIPIVKFEDDVISLLIRNEIIDEIPVVGADNENNSDTEDGSSDESGSDEHSEADDDAISLFQEANDS
jgi:hypothetical protein